MKYTHKMFESSNLILFRELIEWYILSMAMISIICTSFKPYDNKINIVDHFE